MIHQLPILHYRESDLEPYLDSQTMRWHYKLHEQYVTHLNELLARCPGHLRDKALEDLLGDIRCLPEDLRQELRNYGGAHLNHSLLWQILAPGPGSKPRGRLLEVIEQNFRHYDKFRQDFNAAARERFGSGWAWLTVDYRGRLEILTTPNDDSPIMLGCRPILGVDLWEHAYYAKYGGNREAYLEAWWQVVDWQKVAQLYQFCCDSMIQLKPVRHPGKI